jgi:hypothetical protein
MGDREYSHLEAESIKLINKLKDKWESEHLYFDIEYYGKGVDFHAKVNPIIGTQKWLNGQYTIDFINRWTKYEHKLAEDLIPQIEFMHKNILQFEVFNKHKKSVLDLLNEFDNHNNSILETKHSYPFRPLHNTIRFWESLSKMQWKVKTIDFKNLLASTYFYDLKGESNDFYCNKILQYALDVRYSKPIYKNRLGADFASNTPVPIGNLFGKNEDNNIYYRDLLNKSLNKLCSLGFFTKHSKKGFEDSFHPTLFLNILKDTELPSTLFSQGYIKFELIQDKMEELTSNYCELKDIEETNLVRKNIYNYFEIINECNDAYFTPSDFKSAHKLASYKSGVKLI